jgi:hypothetical protein
MRAALTFGSTGNFESWVTSLWSQVSISQAACQPDEIPKWLKTNGFQDRLYVTEKAAKRHRRVLIRKRAGNPAVDQHSPVVKS